MDDWVIGSKAITKYSGIYTVPAPAQWPDLGSQMAAG